MFSMKKTFAIFFMAGALAFSPACGSDADSCSSDTDCLAGQYCATGGGVFFQSGQCLNRSSTSEEISANSEDLDATPTANDQDVSVPGLDALEDQDGQEPDAEQPDPGTPTGDQCAADIDCESDIVFPTIEVTQCAYESTCTETGSKIVETQIVHCFEGLCYQKPVQTTIDCARNTAEESCGDLNPSVIWGECEYKAECSQSGVVYGTIIHSFCEAGTCSKQENSEVENNSRCDRNTNGNTCSASGSPSTCNSGTCLMVTIPKEKEEDELALGR